MNANSEDWPHDRCSITVIKCGKELGGISENQENKTP